MHPKLGIHALQRFKAVGMKAKAALLRGHRMGNGCDDHPRPQHDVIADFYLRVVVDDTVVIGKEVLPDLCPVPHGNMKGEIHREGRAVYAAEQTPQEEVSQGNVPERRLVQSPLQPLAAKHRSEVLTGGGVKGLNSFIINYYQAGFSRLSG